MRSTDLLVALAAGFATVLSEELRATDVPSACSTICQPIVSLTGTCDVDPNEPQATDDAMRRKLYLRAGQGSDDADETIEANCICKNKSFDVAGVMALCASCIKQNGKADGMSRPTPSECGNGNLLMLEQN